jgi:hypothetical protein
MPKPLLPVLFSGYCDEVDIEGFSLITPEGMGVSEDAS